MFSRFEVTFSQYTSATPFYRGCAPVLHHHCAARIDHLDAWEGMGRQHRTTRQSGGRAYLAGAPPGAVGFMCRATAERGLLLDDRKTDGHWQTAWRASRRRGAARHALHGDLFSGARA